MANVDDGGPAFPSRTETVLTKADGTRQTTMVEDGFRGMSLRDWFAGQALAGLLATTMQYGGEDIPDPHYAANLSYQYAGAMLREREVQK